MVRAHIKKLIDTLQPPQIKARMYTDPLRRRMHAIFENAVMRYRRDLLALYEDKVLTDEKVRLRWDKASERFSAALAKQQPLRDRLEREVTIPALVASGVLKPEALPRRRRR